MMVAVIILGVVCLVLAVLLLKNSRKPAETEGNLMLKQDLTTINEQMQTLRESLQGHLTERLDKNQESMSKQLEASSRLIKDVTERLTKLDDTNKRVVDVADELKVLKNVLQNPKQRGVLGEFYLKQILENLLPPNSYELQYKLGEGLVVDAVIKIDDKFLPVDSKFSLENYNRMLEADGAERDNLQKLFKEDVKKRIDETAKYVLPKKGTLDQALMFIPSEAIYYDLLAHKVGAGGVNGRDLIQYAASKHVTIVGPSTLSANLQVIVQSLSSIEIQKDTEIIRKNIEQLKTHLINYDGYFKKIGTSLGATVGHYNSASKELGRIDKDIVKIGGGEAVIEAETISRPNSNDE